MKKLLEFLQNQVFNSRTIVFEERCLYLIDKKFDEINRAKDAGYIRSILFLIIGLSLASNIFAANLADKYIALDGHKIHYYVTGTGKPVVLLTGYGVTTNFWSAPFIQCLAQNRTVYLLDYQGINTGSPASPQLSIKMMADDTNRTIEKLHLDHPEVVGWSMGGTVALQLAYTYPHSISELVLISPALPTANIDNPLPHPIPKLNSADDVLNFVFANNIYNYKKSYLNQYKAQILNPDKLLFPDHAQTSLERIAIKSWVINLNNLSNLYHTQTPAKFILADKDIMLNHEEQATLLKNYANSTIIIVKNSGHAIFYQYPKYVCQEILN